MTKIQLAYIAGLLDGEGHCRVVSYKASKNGQRYYRAQVSIYNSDTRCLDYVRKCLGVGWVGLNSRASTHKIKKHHKDGYKWTVSNRKCLEFLNTIRPYVKIKGEQIDAVLTGPNSGRVQCNTLK